MLVRSVILVTLVTPNTGNICGFTTLSCPRFALRVNLQLTPASWNHRIKVGKTSKIIKSNRQPNTTMPAEPRPDGSGLPPPKDAADPVATPVLSEEWWARRYRVTREKLSGELPCCQARAEGGC